MSLKQFSRRVCDSCGRAVEADGDEYKSWTSITLWLASRTLPPARSPGLCFSFDCCSQECFEAHLVVLMRRFSDHIRRTVTGNPASRSRP